MTEYYPIEVIQAAGMTDSQLPKLQKILQLYPDYINTTNPQGDNALLLAVKENNFQIVKYLVEKTNIDKEYKGKDGNAIHIALNNHNMDMFNYLMKKNIPLYFPYISAAKVGNFNVIKKLKGDIQEINSLGNAFTVAVDKNETKIAIYLMKKGIDITVPSNKIHPFLISIARKNIVIADMFTKNNFLDKVDLTDIFKDEKATYFSILQQLSFSYLFSLKSFYKIWKHTRFDLYNIDDWKNNILTYSKLLLEDDKNLAKFKFFFQHIKPDWQMELKQYFIDEIQQRYLYVPKILYFLQKEALLNTLKKDLKINDYHVVQPKL